MITASFFDSGRAFEIKGHSGSSKSGNDIICASVSSAAYMTANTITDIIGAKADIKVRDGYMRFRLTESNAEAERLIEGLELHMKELSKQYPKNVIRLKLKSK